ncbi:RNA polymerase sigma-70 factor, ECF subfamily [Parapedobacter composti]|uniref:RNA polymerase sigma-70 factor, ECF subfamily n=1 Tax=Parapedobacter composti TaxID=623281 RepID=A0A1I1E0Y0_9SPHI|nr:RNA polymerase sigma-70 factor [Parapedobacter composti]SFB80724.1 RNA polymerase sigma-70 factor, ECF subfamily [Parapedobacter composti]
MGNQTPHVASHKQAIDPASIIRLRQGDEQAFKSIFLALHERVYRFALTYTKNEELSKEVTQEAFIQLWLHREKLSENLPLYPYLFTHVRRLTIDAFRKNAIVQRFNQEWLTYPEQLSNQTEETIHSNEITRITDDLVNKLPRQQRVVFRMSRFYGLTYDEIAERLNISKYTVKYHLVTALKTLKQYLIKHDILYFALSVLAI